MSASDIKEIVVSRILELCEKEGRLPWIRPWKIKSGGFPCNMDTKHVYRGVNAIMLLMAPYDSHYYLTFKGIKARDLSIKKGEKPWPIYFCQYPRKGEVDTKGNPKFPIVRFYKVWNITQLDGDIKPPKDALIKDDRIKHDPIKVCEDIMAAYKDGPEISYGGNKACYYPSSDKIIMPKMEQFNTAEHFYNTLFHEAVHSTANSKRLDRESLKDSKVFGDRNYSEEELVAELGATLLCAMAGIEKVTIENSAAYIKSWMSKLKSDKLLLFNAAQQAQKACDLITGLVHESNDIRVNAA